ncbi:MAG TPA: DUF423 domain-containing protein [Taishania sp.]|nr:DUF423 domain-containing protein [Taishania sp.]
MNKKFVITAAILITLAIMLGAFGAHGLKKIVTPEQVASFEAGVRYQFYAAFGLLILALNEDKFQTSIKVVYNLLLVGMFLFSFSIYLLSLQDYLNIKLAFLGPITPIGGVLMISSWIILTIKLIRSK